MEVRTASGGAGAGGGGGGRMIDTTEHQGMNPATLAEPEPIIHAPGAQEVEETSFTPHDVVLGKGNGINSLPGNLKFRQLIQKYRTLYLETERMKKAAIAELVLNEIARLEPAGRFLEPLSGNERFKEVSRKRALEKTCQALREKTKTSQLGHEQHQGGSLTRKVSPSVLPPTQTAHFPRDFDPTMPNEHTFSFNSQNGSAVPVANRVPLPPQQRIEQTSSEESSAKPLLQNTNDSMAPSEIVENKPMDTNNASMNASVAPTVAEAEPPKAVAANDPGKPQMAALEGENAPIWPFQDNDVLYGGRGRKHFHRVANQRFLELIKFSREEYQSSRSKKRVAINIISKWRNQHPQGRFLQQSKDDRWFEIPEAKILEKTCQALRDLKRERGPGGVRSTIADRMVDPRGNGQKPALVRPQQGPPHNQHPAAPTGPPFRPPHPNGPPMMTHHGHGPPPHWAPYPPHHSRGMYPPQHGPRPPPGPPASHLMYNGNPSYMPQNAHRHAPLTGAPPSGLPIPDGPPRLPPGGPPPPSGPYHGVHTTVGNQAYPGSVQELGEREDLPSVHIRGPSPAMTKTGQPPPKLPPAQPGPPQHPAAVAAIQRQASIVAQEMQKMDDMMRRANSSGVYPAPQGPAPPHWHPPHPRALSSSRSTTPVVEAPPAKHPHAGPPPNSTANPRITPPNKMAVVDIVPRPPSVEAAPPALEVPATTRVVTNLNAQSAPISNAPAIPAQIPEAIAVDQESTGNPIAKNEKTENQKPQPANDDAPHASTKGNDEPDNTDKKAPDDKPSAKGDTPDNTTETSGNKTTSRGELEAATLLANMLGHSSSGSSS